MENRYGIKLEQIQKGQFLLIDYWESERTFILVKVANKKRIYVLAESESNKVHLDEIESYFTLRDFTYSQRLIKKEKELVIETGSSSQMMINRVVILKERILKKMAQKTIKEKEEITIKAKKEEDKFRKTMEKIGLLDIQKKK